MTTYGQSVVDFCQDKINATAKSDLNSALKWACREGSPEAVNLLIQAGADPSAGLFDVSRNSVNRVKIMKILMDSGAEMDTFGGTEALEYTPFMWAMFENDLDMVEFFYRKQMQGRIW